MTAHRVIPTPLDGEPVEFGALELPILPPSLNNIFLNVKKGRIKSPEYRTWQTRACLHLRKQGAWHVPGPIRVRLTFNGGRTRADLDNLIKPMLDLLMAAGRISDDRNVRRIEAEFSPNIAGTLIEIRRADSQPAAQVSALYSAKKMRSLVAASVAAIGASSASKGAAPAAEPSSLHDTTADRTVIEIEAAE